MDPIFPDPGQLEAEWEAFVAVLLFVIAFVGFVVWGTRKR